MRRFPLLPALLLLIQTACQSPGPRAASPPPIPIEAVNLTIVQRTARLVPANAPVVSVTIGDITAGQTLTTISRAKGTQILLDTTSLKEGDARRFEVDSHRYELKLVKIHNLLTGDDFAEFQLHGIEGELSDAEKIDAAIRKIESSGLTFVRNGTEHSAKDAADHLRTKLKNAGRDINYGKFIDDVATKSSMTGQPYQVKLADGSTMEMKAWLAR